MNTAELFSLLVMCYLFAGLLVGVWTYHTVWNMNGATRRAAKLAGALAALLVPLFVLFLLPYWLWKEALWVRTAGRELYRTFVPEKPKDVELPKAQVHR